MKNASLVVRDVVAQEEIDHASERLILRDRIDLLQELRYRQQRKSSRFSLTSSWEQAWKELLLELEADEMHAR